MAVMTPAHYLPTSMTVILLGVVVSSIFLRWLLEFWNMRHIPGPFQAKITNFWMASKLWNCEDFRDIALDLHAKYGPVVRYGPNRVLLGDLSAVSAVFNTKHPLVKSESYEVAFQAVNGKLISSLATTRDEARVSALKKQIISAFTTTAILDYEHHIDHNIKSLMKYLEEDGPDVNIAKWCIFFTFDTICRIAFSDDQGFMDKQSDLGNTLQGARERFSHWHTWQSLPKLEKLLFKNRFASRVTGTSLLAKLAGERVQKRIEDGGIGAHSDLLDRYLQASIRDPVTFDKSTILGLVISIIHAGAETTASTLSIVLHYLLTNPQAMKKLREEIYAANLSSPPPWLSVNKLQYLEAAVKESMRMNPLLQDPIERDVPESGMEISGVFIPGGTIVAINVHALSRDPTIWGDDFAVYRPERWLEAGEAQISKMERANLSFSAGRRMCIGQHIAWIEMKKFLSELLNRFDVGPAD
ncbi:uncharacterized protein Z518_09460 [Rhinocladiella mackenziei CBS 650.93]|uniref:Rhinocladiella mackenziei CBS 650.93 unplaced genomic scaffold supercont1.7, whole genome shotgun sequence n=1 Tax=Rhinocladiella mackenziei CBS 650.93 TaxID=1442369 RepID=A0A0D2I7B4_9EURO|nr:uncharacterized protein Z518_09460 [Rhinocladiella mackenziei CBS 650.93]KIX01734.1 hypothetical protein Z518_09460 [Rhinocladiella mackenziei CBS 650.93]